MIKATKEALNAPIKESPTEQSTPTNDKTPQKKGLVISEDQLDNLGATRAANVFGGSIDFEFDPSDYVGYHSIVPGANMDEIRAYSQSKGEKWGNALVQAGAELTLGTLEGLGYLLDGEQYYNMVNGTEQEFGNWFSDMMRKGKEYIRDESNPIYSPEASMGFAPGSASWWSRNLPSIVSTVSLMVPALGATKALGYLGKVSRASRLIRSANTQQNLKGISSALFSRYMENTMESAETMESMIKELTPEVGQAKAQEIAAKAAAKQWHRNTANIVFDLFQYGSIFRGGKYASAAMKDLAKRQGLRTAGRVTANAAQEGAEEALQFVTGQEAAYESRVEAGTQGMRDSGDRFAEYIRDGELWTAVTFGALGGAVFDAVGQYNNVRERKERQQRDQLLMGTYAKLTADMAQSDANRDPVEKVIAAENQDHNFMQLALSHAMNGTLGKVKADMRELQYAPKEALEQLASTEEANNENEVNRFAKDVGKRIKQLDTIERIFDNEMDNANRSNEVKSDIAINRVREYLSTERATEYRARINEAWKTADDISSQAKSLLELQKMQGQMKLMVKALQDQKKKVDSRTGKIMMKQRIDGAQRALKAVNDKLRERNQQENFQNQLEEVQQFTQKEKHEDLLAAMEGEARELSLQEQLKEYVGYAKTTKGNKRIEQAYETDRQEAQKKEKEKEKEAELNAVQKSENIDLLDETANDESKAPEIREAARKRKVELEKQDTKEKVTKQTDDDGVFDISEAGNETIDYERETVDGIEKRRANKTEVASDKPHIKERFALATNTQGKVDAVVDTATGKAINITDGLSPLQMIKAGTVEGASSRLEKMFPDKDSLPDAEQKADQNAEEAKEKATTPKKEIKQPKSKPKKEGKRKRFDEFLESEEKETDSTEAEVTTTKLGGSVFTTGSRFQVHGQRGKNQIWAIFKEEKPDTKPYLVDANGNVIETNETLLHSNVRKGTKVELRIVNTQYWAQAKQEAEIKAKALTKHKIGSKEFKQELHSLEAESVPIGVYVDGQLVTFLRATNKRYSNKYFDIANRGEVNAHSLRSLVYGALKKGKPVTGTITSMEPGNPLINFKDVEKGQEERKQQFIYKAETLLEGGLAIAEGKVQKSDDPDYVVYDTESKRFIDQNRTEAAEIAQRHLDNLDWVRGNMGSSADGVRYYAGRVTPNGEMHFYPLKQLDGVSDPQSINDFLTSVYNNEGNTHTTHFALVSDVKVEGKGINPQSLTFRASNKAKQGKLNEKKAKAWLQKRFGKELGVKIYEQHKQINGSTIHGYYDGAAHTVALWGMTTTNTAYHEGFHVLFRGHLTQAQRNALYAEAAKKYGIGKNWKGSKEDRLAIEERLAEDFLSYASQQEKPKTIPEKIWKFFKDLYNYLLTYVKHSRSIQQVFSNLESGQLNVPLERNMSFDNEPVAYRMTNLSNDQVMDAMNSLLYLYLDNYNLTETTSVKRMKEQMEGIVIRHMVNTPENDITIGEAKEALENHGIEAIANGETDYVYNPAARTLYDNWKAQVDENGNPTTYGLEDVFIFHLRRNGFKVGSGEIDVQEDAEFDWEGIEDVAETGDDAKNHRNTSIDDSMFDRLGEGLKRSLSRVVKRDENGEAVINQYGTPEFYSYRDVFSALLNLSDGSISFQDRILTWQRAASNNEIVRDFLQDFRSLTKAEQAKLASLTGIDVRHFQTYYQESSKEDNGITKVEVSIKDETELAANRKFVERVSNRLVDFRNTDNTNVLVTMIEKKGKTQKAIVPVKVHEFTQIMKVLNAFRRNKLNTDKEYDRLLDTALEMMYFLGVDVNRSVLDQYAQHLSERNGKSPGKNIIDILYGYRTAHKYSRKNTLIKKGVPAAAADVIGSDRRIENADGTMQTEFPIDGLFGIADIVIANKWAPTNKNLQEFFGRLYNVEAFTKGKPMVVIVSGGKKQHPMTMPSALSFQLEELKQDESRHLQFRQDEFFRPFGTDRYQSPLLSIFHHPETADVAERIYMSDVFQYSTDDGNRNDFTNMFAAESLKSRLIGYLQEEEYGLFSFPNMGDRGRMVLMRLPKIASMQMMEQQSAKLQAEKAKKTGKLFPPDTPKALKALRKVNGEQDVVRNTMRSYIIQDLQDMALAKEELQEPNLSDEQRKILERRLSFRQLQVNDSLIKDLFPDADLKTDMRLSDLAGDLYFTVNDGVRSYSLDEMGISAQAVIDKAVLLYLREKVGTPENPGEFVLQLKEEMQNAKLIEKQVESEEDKDSNQFVKRNSPFANIEANANHLIGKGKAYKTLDQFLVQFIYDNIIAYNEMQKMFMGDPANTKNMLDAAKRASMMTTTGKTGVTKDQLPSGDYGMKPTINVGILPDQFVNSLTTEGENNELDQLRDVMVEQGVSVDEAQEIVDAYRAEDGNGPTTTDGLTMTTVEEHVEILQGHGMSSPEIDKAFEEYKTTGKWDNNVPLNPLKTLYNRLVKNPKTQKMEWVTIKHASFPLLPAYVNKVPALKDIHDRMTLQGEYADKGLDRIDWVTHPSALKTSGHPVGLDTPLVLDRKGMLLAQNVPVHGQNKITFSSQLWKNMASNIDKSATYYMPNYGKVSGQELLDIIDTAQGRMLELAYNKTTRRLNLPMMTKTKEAYLSDPGNESKRIAYYKAKKESMLAFRELVYEQVRDDKVSVPQVESLRIISDHHGEPQFEGMLEFGANAKKFEEILFALVKNNVQKLETRGVGAVQLGEIGGAKIGGKESRLKFFTKATPEEMFNGKSLEQLNEKEREKFASIAIDYAEIDIPYHLAEKFGIQPGDDLSKLPDSARKVLGYRIPHSGKNLTVPLKIRQVLPKSMGDSVIVPAEITVLMGSDFDIDKLWVMMPNLDRSGNAVRFRKRGKSNRAEATETIYQGVKYRALKKKDKSISFVDEQGNEAPYYAKRDMIYAMARDNDFNRGKSANDFADEISREEAQEFNHATGHIEFISRYSENPAEVAVAMAEVGPYVPIEEKDYAYQAIWEIIGKGAINKSSFEQFGDPNWLSDAKYWIDTKNSQGNSGNIDIIAQEASDNAGIEIAPQDVVDFVMTYKSNSAFAKEKNELYEELHEKFIDLTGFSITPKGVRIINERYERQTFSEDNQETSAARAGDVATTEEKTATKVRIVQGTANTKQAAREGLGIYVMRPNERDNLPLVDAKNHFGNPWSHAGYQNTIKTPDIATAVDYYEKWLKGEAFQDVEPARRKWILDQIANGVFQGQDMLYFKEGYRSHADVLADFVNSREKTAEPAVPYPKDLKENLSLPAAQNALLSAFMAIAQHPGHLSEMMRSTDNTILDELADDIEQRTGDVQGNLNRNNPVSDLQVEMINKLGADNINVFASSLSGFNLQQHIDLVVEDKYLPQINGVQVPKKPGQKKVLPGLSFTNAKGDVITDAGMDTSYVYNTHLQKALDNSKNPVHGRLNVTQKTGDIVNYLTSLGLGHYMPVLFLNQGVIQEVVNDQLNNPSMNMSYLIGEKIDAIAGKKYFSTLKEKHGKELTTFPMDVQSLYDNVGKRLSKRKEIELLWNMHVFNQAGTQMRSINRRLMVDRAQRLIGYPNLLKMRKDIDKAKNNFVFKDNDSLDSIFVEHHYEKRILNLMDEIIEAFMPAYHDGYKSLFNVASANTYGEYLSDSELYEMRNDYALWLMTQNGSPIASLFSANAFAQTFYGNKDNNVADLLSTMQKKYGKQYPFLETLYPLKKRITNDEGKTVTFNSVRHMAPNEGFEIEQQYSAEFEQIINAEDPALRKLGLRLLTNTLGKYGLGTQFGSYTHLIPSSIFYSTKNGNKSVAAHFRETYGSPEMVDFFKQWNRSRFESLKNQKNRLKNEGGYDLRNGVLTITDPMKHGYVFNDNGYIEQRSLLKYGDFLFELENLVRGEDGSIREARYTIVPSAESKLFKEIAFEKMDRSYVSSRNVGLTQKHKRKRSGEAGLYNENEYNLEDHMLAQTEYLDENAIRNCKI